MNIQWESLKLGTLKPSNRWGHSSCTLPCQYLVVYGGYVNSQYLNDVWLYNNKNNLWYEVQLKQQRKKPSQRSNSSFFYCQNLKSIIMFGGGANDGVRYNDLWTIKITENTINDSFEGQWTQLYPSSQKIPWGRTYHASQLYENFLFIHGGQSYVGEIEDFWALDLNNLRWIQLKSSHKLQSRKFHASAIIKNKFFIFGGIYGNYQILNKIQSVDISIIKTGDYDAINNNDYIWEEVAQISNQSIFIGRWGHVSKVYQDQVYIFGGRDSIDQSDLIVFNPKTNGLRRLVTYKQPQGRRKPAIWLIGSYLIINSGYNGKYLDDFFMINLRFIKENTKLIEVSGFSQVPKRDICDIHINTVDNKYLDLNSNYIKNSFESQYHMMMFLQQLAEMKKSKAQRYALVLNKGIYIKKDQQQQIILSDETIPSSNQSQQIDQKVLKKFKITYSTNQLLSNKKKVLFNVVKQNLVMNLNPLKLIKLTRQQFDRIFLQIENNCCNDTIIYVDHKNQSKEELQKSIKCCKYPLIQRSQFFKNIFSNAQLKGEKFIRNNQYPNQIYLQIPQVILQIIIIYCYYGHVLVPLEFNLSQFQKLYQEAKKYSLNKIMSIVFQQLKQLIVSERSIKIISKNLHQLLNNGKRNLKIQTKQMIQIDQKQQTMKGRQEIGQIQEILEYVIVQSQRKFKVVRSKRGIRVENGSQLSEILQLLIHKASQIYIKNWVRERRRQFIEKDRAKKVIKINMKIKESKELEDQNKENKLDYINRSKQKELNGCKNVNQIRQYTLQKIQKDIKRNINRGLFQDIDHNVQQCISSKNDQQVNKLHQISQKEQSQSHAYHPKFLNFIFALIHQYAHINFISHPKIQNPLIQKQTHSSSISRQVSQVSSHALDFLNIKNNKKFSYQTKQMLVYFIQKQFKKSSFKLHYLQSLKC